MRDRPRVLLAADHFAPAFRFGGPIQSLAALVARTKDCIDWRVVTRATDFRSTTVLDGVVPDRWSSFEDSLRRYTMRVPGLWEWRRLLEETRPDAVYLNSFLSRPFSMAVMAALMGVWSRVPVVIAPRGELAPGAMRVRRGRKAAFVALARALPAYRRCVWHAASDLEALEIRDAMGEVAVRTIPNIPATLMPAPMPPKVRGELRAVFVGRIAPKKNLDGLLRGLSMLSATVHLDIIGVADDPAYLAECRRLAADLPDRISVAWVGSLPPTEVHERVRDAHCLLLPTHAENFGHAIAEALALGRPALVGEHTPWTDALRAGAGIAVDADDVRAIARGIDSLAAMDQAELGGAAQRAARAGRMADAASDEVALMYSELFTNVAGVRRQDQ